MNNKNSNNLTDYITCNHDVDCHYNNQICCQGEYLVYDITYHRDEKKWTSMCDYIDS